MFFTHIVKHFFFYNRYAIYFVISTVITCLSVSVGNNNSYLTEIIEQWWVPHNIITIQSISSKQPEITNLLSENKFVDIASKHWTSR